MKRCFLSLRKLSGLALLCITASTDPANCQTIVYRETFGNASGSNASFATVGWTNTVYNSTAGLFTNLVAVSNSRGISSLPGRPADLDNVNAGTSASLTNGFAFVGSAPETGVNVRTLSFTSEYSLPLAAANITQVSYFAGHTGTDLSLVRSRPAFLVAGTWYVTTTFATTASINGANFASSAELETFVFTGTTALYALNGADLAVMTDTTYQLDSLGMVSSFGLFANTPSNQDFVRFDTFAVTVPEPSGVAGVTVGMVGAILFGLRRRRNADRPCRS
ncbi:MAG: PEP-CTERM sorting domain-containing protein [Terrimicrobiaceae bacterium]|nr:PEP-CTERM sorting domain-containing protein [Terrimicrobiaceae bacterium]